MRIVTPIQFVFDLNANGRFAYARPELKTVQKVFKPTMIWRGEFKVDWLKSWQVTTKTPDF